MALLFLFTLIAMTAVLVLLGIRMLLVPGSNFLHQCSHSGMPGEKNQCSCKEAGLTCQRKQGDAQSTGCSGIKA